MNILSVTAKTDEFPTFYSKSLVPVLMEAAKRGHNCTVATTDLNFPAGPYEIKHVECPVLKAPYDPEFLREQKHLMKQFGENRDYIHWLTAGISQYATQESWERELFKIIDDHKPDVITNIADQDTLAKSSAHAAYRRKLPSVTWLPVLVGTHPTVDAPASDYAAIGGDAIAEYYVSYGFPRELLIPTGHPYFDSITPTSHGSKVMFGTENCRLNEALAAFKQTVEICERNNRKIILSIHPRENFDPWLEAIQGHRLELVIGPRNNAELLKECSHVIMNQSGLGLEALLSGCRIVIYPNGRRLFIDFLGEGAAIPLHDGFLDREEPRGVQRFIERWNVSNDGHASRRIVDFLETLAS